jgi:hypothetical protein
MITLLFMLLLDKPETGEISSGNVKIELTTKINNPSDRVL